MIPSQSGKLCATRLRTARPIVAWASQAGITIETSMRVCRNYPLALPRRMPLHRINNRERTTGTPGPSPQPEGRMLEARAAALAIALVLVAPALGQAQDLIVEKKTFTLPSYTTA